jgi:uncharacterized protein (DUF58 family)
LHFTREGWVFTAMAVAIGLIAVNTSHNLFYLIFALLLGVVIVSGLLSEVVLRGIEVRRQIPSEITARVPFAVILQVRNLHRKRHAYSLTVSDGGDFLPRRRLGYIPSLAPGETRTFHYLAQAESRGRHRFGSLHLITRFPFGLFEKVRLISSEQGFVAYPAHREVPQISPSVAGKEGAGRKKSRWGEEILGLRPAAEEDDYRLIHWPTSARAGLLMVREFVQDVEQPRALFFDNRAEAGERFERAVEVAASLIRWFSSQGVALTFSTWEMHFEPTASADEMNGALRHLALIFPSNETGQNGGFEEWRHHALRDGTGIFLRVDGSPLPTLPSCEVVQA